MGVASAEVDWHEVVARYARPDLRRSLWQLASTFALYGGLWYAMIRSLEVSYALTLLLALPAAGVLIRLFIVQHDCGHGSFFRRRWACDAVGTALGVLTFTPYLRWSREHAIHHATVGNLDRRGTGDVWTMTVSEYRQRPRWQRALYRIYRSPFFLFGLGSFLLFLLLQRVTFKPRSLQEAVSVYATDLAIAGLATAASLAVGLRGYLLVQAPILFLSAAAGVWLFYVQHQFDGVHWWRHESWDYHAAALRGSSFYRLPRMLQWFSGNIGFHHLHHLSPRIPNYLLPVCHRENPGFRPEREITMRTSLRSLSLRLWDERSGRMVGFHEPAPNSR